MRFISFTGTDNTAYTFETVFTKEIIEKAVKADDLPTALYYKASQLSELYPYYEDYYRTLGQGETPSIAQAKKLDQFVTTILDQIIEDFIKAYPEHIISQEYHPVKGISERGRLAFFRLLGPMSVMRHVLFQMFASPEEIKTYQESEDNKQKEIKVKPPTDKPKKVKSKLPKVKTKEKKKRKVLTLPSNDTVPAPAKPSV